MPADKAANNFVIVCKKYYVTVLMNELGIDFNTYACLGNVTYKPVQTDGNVIINKHLILYAQKKIIAFLNCFGVQNYTKRRINLGLLLVQGIVPPRNLPLELIWV